jgi:hypothetical protein
MKRLEKILIILSFISLVMIFNQYQGSTEMFALSLAALAGIYFPLGFLFFSRVGIRQFFKGGLNDKKASATWRATISGLGLSILCIGILFRCLHFPGGSEMLVIGIFISLIMLAIELLKFFRNSSGEGSLTLSRLTGFIIVSAVLLFTSSATMLRLQYRNYPGYADAYLEYQNNPTPETKARERKEYMKMILSPEDFSKYDDEGK